jgi:hypothetical protein
MRKGFRKRLTDLRDVGAVAGGSVVSHTVGVASIHVAAVEHVALQLAVLAELVLAKTVPGHNPALLWHAEESIQTLGLFYKRIIGCSLDPEVLCASHAGLYWSIGCFFGKSALIANFLSNALLPCHVVDSAAKWVTVHVLVTVF